MRPALLALLLIPGAVLAQGAPFCVVTGAGNQCWYYDANSCRQNAAAMRGMCVPNQAQTQSPPTLQLPDIAGSFERGAAAGRQQRMEREEHEARLELLRAQTEAAKKSSEQPFNWGAVTEKVMKDRAVFVCQDDAGNWTETRVPAIGCVVVRFD